jgi:hypothetical protein
MGRRTITGTRRIAALALGALLVTGLAACGDEGDGDEDVVLEDIGASSAGDDPDDGDDREQEGTDTTVTTDPADGPIEGCEEFSAAFEDLGNTIGAGFGEFGEDDGGEAIAAFSELVEEAPEEIRDDLQLFADAFQAYAAALEASGFDTDDPSSIDPDAAAELGELGEIFSDPEFLAASEAIEEFVASGCGS